MRSDELHPAEVQFAPPQPGAGISQHEPLRQEVDAYCEQGWITYALSGGQIVRQRPWDQVRGVLWKAAHDPARDALAAGLWQNPLNAKLGLPRKFRAAKIDLAFHADGVPLIFVESGKEYEAVTREGWTHVLAPDDRILSLPRPAIQQITWL